MKESDDKKIAITVTQNNDESKLMPSNTHTILKSLNTNKIENMQQVLAGHDAEETENNFTK